MNIITTLVILALPALAVSGYYLRSIARRRTAEFMAAAVGASTIPLLHFGAGIVPNALLGIVPVSFVASIILGCLIRDRGKTAVESPNKLETAGTIVLLMLCSFYCLGLGAFFLAQLLSVSTTPTLLLLAVAMYAVAGIVGVRSSVNLAFSRS
jgi:hypothetical protein